MGIGGCRAQGAYGGKRARSPSPHGEYEEETEEDLRQHEMTPEDGGTAAVGACKQ